MEEKEVLFVAYSACVPKEAKLKSASGQQQHVTSNGFLSAALCVVVALTA